MRILKNICRNIQLQFNTKALERFTHIKPDQRDYNDYRNAIECVLDATSAASGVHKQDLITAYLRSPYSDYDTSDTHDRRELLKSNPDLYGKICRMDDSDRTLYMLSLFLSDTFDTDPNLSTLQNYAREIPMN